MIDVNAWIGDYPFRHLPSTDPASLARAVEHAGLAGAWVGHLPSVWWRDPAPGNALLYESLASFSSLQPAPSVRPDWPRWERQVQLAVEHGAAALRAYPVQWGLGPGDASVSRLVGACGEAGLALVLTVRFEDLRQRHALDVAADLSAAYVRAIARLRGTAGRTPLVVTHAGRDLIEEIAWSLTEEERSRVWFDFSCVWGPPEDHLATLFHTLGAARFVYGTGWPLRLAETPAASLALLPDALRDASITDAASLVAPRDAPAPVARVVAHT